MCPAPLDLHMNSIATTHDTHLEIQSMDRNISVRDVPFVNPRRRLCQIRRHPQHQCQGVLTSLVGALTAPLTAGAQQAGKPTIGILDLGSAAGMRRWDALREGLRDLGQSRARLGRSSTVPRKTRPAGFLLSSPSWLR